MPLWLLGVGMAAGLVLLAILYGLAAIVSRQLFTFLNDSLREGFLRPVLFLAAGIAVIGLLTSFAVPMPDLWRSLDRLRKAGDFELSVTVPADAKDERVDLEARPSELKRLEINSDQELTITLEEYGIIKQAQQGSIQIFANEPWKWAKATGGGSATEPTKGAKIAKAAPAGTEADVENGTILGENNLFYGDASAMQIKNLSGKPAQVRLSGFTTEEFPEVRVVPYGAVGLVGLVLLFLLIKAAFPKIMAIALATAREATVQPLFLVVTILGVVALIVFVVIPYHTLGEDVKMLMLVDVTQIKVLAIIVALWTASESVSSELEGRTAMTVLSKPIGRRQFLLGKFLGVVLAVALLMLILGAVFLLTIPFKVVYDARESAQLPPTWQACCAPMIGAMPGLLLAFFEAVMLTAVSVALSTRLPLLANLIICTSVYILGHLVPLLVVTNKMGDTTYGIIHFFGQLFAAILPVLDHFDVEAATSTDTTVPLHYLVVAFGYCALYSTVAMLLALILFEDRDLA